MVCSLPLLLSWLTEMESRTSTCTLQHRSLKKKRKGRTTPWTKQPRLQEMVRSRLTGYPSHFYLIYLADPYRVYTFALPKKRHSFPAY